jgi:beta-galactosidase/beta-glucuronidase
VVRGTRIGDLYYLLELFCISPVKFVKTKGTMGSYPASLFEIFLNYQHLLTTDNMYSEWNVDVKMVLIKGKNLLRRLFHSPVLMGILSRDNFNFEAPLGYNLEITNTDWPNVGPYTRKAGYMFGWDWGPKFTTSGNRRPVFLKAWDEVKIQFTVTNPKLWWPSGLGDHPVYEINGLLKKENIEIDRIQTHAGLRNVRLGII